MARAPNQDLKSAFELSHIFICDDQAFQLIGLSWDNETVLEKESKLKRSNIITKTKITITTIILSYKWD